jgi:xanthine dehydrogenase YagS FAD-binding subunit
MRAFEYNRATSVEDAVALLQATDTSAARPLAGGTDLLPLMKADIAAPQRLVDIKRLPALAAGVARDPSGLRIGALTTLASIESDPGLQREYTAVAEAAGLAATPQLRNMATLGGNLLQRPRCWYFRSSLLSCWLKGGQDCPARDGENQLHAVFDTSPCVAVHPSDLAATLMAFDAEVQLNTRSLPVADFFVPPTEDHRLETSVQPDELIVSVHLPTQAAGTRSTYLKAMNRKVWAFALVGVAAVVRMDAGRVLEARVVLGGVAPIPWRARAAEQRLVGSAPSAAALEEAAGLALADARPLAHNGYKIPLARALVRQALASVCMLS